MGRMDDSRQLWRAQLAVFKEQRQALADARAAFTATRAELLTQLLISTREAVAASPRMRRSGLSLVIVDDTLELLDGPAVIARVSMHLGEVILSRVQHGEQLWSARSLDHADPVLLAGDILKTIEHGAFAPSTHAVQ